VTRVLVVDDDPALLRALRIGLEVRGFEVIAAHTGAEGLSRAAQAMPHLVVLDLGLPDIDGVEVCKRLRQWTDVPVIVLSALDSEDRKVLALDSGADDYVTKPFGMQELEARLRVALRHSAARDPSSAPATLTVGPIHVDVASRTVKVGGSAIELTAREFDLLAYLARNAGKVCTHRTILREVWGPGYGNETHYLRVYASRLRRKLGDEGGPLLRTNPGVGYQLVDERPTQPPGAGGGGAPGHCGDEPPGSVRGAPGHGGGEPPGGGGGAPGHGGGEPLGAGDAEPPDGDGHPEGGGGAEPPGGGGAEPPGGGGGHPPGRNWGPPDP
jgi:two-component system KDP operon response regulator KdpE